MVYLSFFIYRMNIVSLNWRKRKCSVESNRSIRKVPYPNIDSNPIELINQSVVSSALLYLPNELLLHILSFLDVNSTLYFGGTCFRIYYLHTLCIWRNITISRQCFDFPFLHRLSQSDIFFSFSSHITAFTLSGRVDSESNMLYGTLRFEPFLHCLSKLPNIISLTLDSYRFEVKSKQSNFSDYIFPKIRNLHFINVHFEIFFLRRFQLHHSFPSLNSLSFNKCPKFCYPIIPFVSYIPHLVTIHIESCYRINPIGLNSVISTFPSFRKRCKCYLDGEII